MSQDVQARGPFGLSWEQGKTLFPPWCFRLIDMRLGTFQYSTDLFGGDFHLFYRKKSIKNLNASFFKSSGAIYNLRKQSEF